MVIRSFVRLPTLLRFRRGASERPRGGRRPLPSARGPRPHTVTQPARVDLAGSGAAPPLAAGPAWLPAPDRDARPPAWRAATSSAATAGRRPRSQPQAARPARSTTTMLWRCPYPRFFFLPFFANPSLRSKEGKYWTVQKQILSCARAGTKGTRVLDFC